MMLLIKQCEDLLYRWDKRIQFEATLLFFFSVVSGSSFISLYMFWKDNVFIVLLPFLYLICMFSWWYICKKMILDTEKVSITLKTDTFKCTSITSIIVWFIISCAVSFGSWDEWGWNTDERFPAIDNIYRFVNCLLVLAYIFTLNYDFYYKIESRNKRIKLWMLYIWIHAIISCAYFGEWVDKGYNKDSKNGDESMGARWLATIGCVMIMVIGLIVFVMKKMSRIILALLFLGLMLYWFGSAALDCEFYADAADMTVMPGYQMLWSMAILILLESVPTLANDIYVLGGSGLLDEDDEYETEMDMNIIDNENDNVNVNDDNIISSNIKNSDVSDINDINDNAGLAIESIDNSALTDDATTADTTVDTTTVAAAGVADNATDNVNNVASVADDETNDSAVNAP